MNDHNQNNKNSKTAILPSKTRPSRPPKRHPLIVSIMIFTFMAAMIVAIIASLLAGAFFSDQIKGIVAPFQQAISGEHDHGEHEDAVATTQFYTCGMHPWVVLPKPGDCPICHMKLTPLDPAKFTGEIAIDPVVTQNIGVRIQPVVKGALERTIRTVGTIDYDETKVRDVNIKVNGWIEKLHVDFLGAKVKTGQPLFDIYSPELYAAQEEYLLAWRGQDLTDGGGLSSIVGQGGDLLAAARTRLEYYDITSQQIDDLQKAGQPSKALTLLSPHTGIVIAKHANEGMKVDPGMQVYRIADLSKVWAMVTLFEYQLPYVQVGQKARMSLSYIPGQTFEGKVIYVYPYLEPKTRQVKVRLEFDNPVGLLKPGMYANVALRSRLAEQRTLAPRAAVIDTGVRQVAFVSLGKGRFEPRDVLLGVEMDNGMVEILDGLKPGEMVVTSGQFLLDSEATMRESLAKMVKGNLAAEQEAAAAKAEPGELAVLPVAMAKTIDNILESYFNIGVKLADDSTAGIDLWARRVATNVDQLVTQSVPGQPHFWREHDEVATLRGKALEIIETKDIVDARLHYADMSIALSKFTRATGVPASWGEPVLEMHCPMYREGQGGAIWLQPDHAVRNPFFGKSMLRCIDWKKALPISEVAPVRSTSTTQPAAKQPSQEVEGGAP